jgi:hypothetical protein
MKHSLEYTIIRLMLLVRRVGAKMGGSLWLLQRILSSLLPADDIDVADEPVHLSDDDNDTDLAPLVAMLPGKKRNGSCLRDNDLSHKDDYDLEIIIPAYNVEQYIDQCLQSVLNQRSKYKCLVVVINDGSTDGTRQHLANYENCPDIEIIDQKNAGLAAARNAALRHIRGRYVTFVDSDDWLLPGAIDTLMDTAIKHDADIVEGCFRLFSGERFYPGYSHPFEVSDHWTGQLQGYACGKVLRAELFAHVCFPEGYLFEDTLMTLILFPRCRRIVTIPDDIYVYRFNPVGITATAGLSPRAVESLLVTVQLMEDGAASGQQTSQLDYENFLQNEVPNTFCTIFSLHNPSVNHHVFSVCCRLLRQYYEGYTTSDPHLQPLEHALRTKDYRACMLAVMTRH